MSKKRKCPNCERGITGHPNKKFCNSRCKDQYHNRTNPRGYGARQDDDVGPYRDGDWERYLNTIHPFSPEAFEP